MLLSWCQTASNAWPEDKTVDYLQSRCSKQTKKSVHTRSTPGEPSPTCMPASVLLVPGTYHCSTSSWGNSCCSHVIHKQQNSIR